MGEDWRFRGTSAFEARRVITPRVGVNREQFLIAILEARKTCPLDDVLEKLDETVEARGSLTNGEKENFTTKLNTRLAELYQQCGGCCG